MEAGSDTNDEPSLRIGLPAQLAPLLGRERDLAALDALLIEDQTRLLTLIGPGGTGKTRLAVAVAHHAADGGANIAFIDCSPLRDAGQILPAVARVFGLQEDDRDPVDLLTAAFAGEALLIVLDNLEQISGAEEPIAALLDRCASVTLLATSRRSVGLSGEQLWPVEPLPLPAGNDLTSVMASPAALLFVAAARRSRPGFAITDRSAAAVAEIVRQVDGLPLAVELAAARLRTLSLDALLARLRQPLVLLSGGSRSLPLRQQTVRATIAWSVDLLSPDERSLYEVMGVFQGGCTLEAATAISSIPAGEVIDLLSGLIDQSLIRSVETADGETRYVMLEAIREEALERLRTRVEAEEIQNRHADYFGRLADELSPSLIGSDQARAFDQLERDFANVTAVLAWRYEQRNDTEMLRVAGAVWRFWYDRGSPSDGRRWLRRALDLSAGVDARLRARALNGLGALCLLQSDYAEARAVFRRAIDAWAAAGEERGRCGSLNNLALLDLRQGSLVAARDGFEQSLSCFRSVNDESGAAFALDNLGYANAELGDHRRAQLLHQEALALHEKLGNAQGIAAALHNLGVAAAALGDDAAATQFHERQLPIVRDLGHRGSEALALNSLGFLASRASDDALATTRYEAALAIWREMGNEHGVALALHNLATDDMRQGEIEGARRLLRESLTIRARLASPGDLAISLYGVAKIALRTEHPVEAVRLAGAATALSPLPEEPPRELDELCDALGESAFAAAWEDGEALTPDQAVGIALMVLTAVGGAAVQSDDPAPLVQPRPAPDPDDHGLTAREIDVLRLIAAGRSNAEIGEALFISPFTAKTHVSNLLAKLGADTRAAAATWAARQGIA